MEREINSFDDIGYERYCSLKDSVESLMKIMNLEGLKKDERTRVLTALIQLITDNSDKPMDLRVSDTRDMIYNGNVFSHYFADKDKETAVQILSNTSILNEVERLIYTINFYMPNDKEFTSVYKEFEKKVGKIAEHYGLSGEDATKFVYARITEISKFYRIYMNYKENQAKQSVSESQVSESQVFVALQEASDNPSLENIENARRLIMALQNESLKAMLTEELENLGIGALSNQEVSGNGYWDIPEESVISGDVKEDTHVFGFSPEEEEVHIPPHLESLAQEPVAYEEETLEPQLELYVPEGNLEMTTGMEDEVVEPTPLQVSQGTKSCDDDNVAEEVKASLQLFVGKAKEDANRVRELESTLASTQDELSRVNALADEQAETIARQSDKIIDFEDAIKARDERIGTLASENEKLHATNEMQSETMKEQREKIIDFEARLQQQNVRIGELKTENETLGRKVIAYQQSFEELGDMLKGTQDMGEYEEESHRKVA